MILSCQQIYQPEVVAHACKKKSQDLGDGRQDD